MAESPVSSRPASSPHREIHDDLEVKELAHEITLPEALAQLRNIEKTYQALYRYTHLPEKTRRRIKDGAAQAHHITGLVNAHERKLRRAED